MDDLIERIMRYTRYLAIEECIEIINKYSEENGLTLGQNNSNIHITRIRRLMNDMLPFENRKDVLS